MGVALNGEKVVVFMRRLVGQNIYTIILLPGDLNGVLKSIQKPQRMFAVTIGMN